MARSVSILMYHELAAPGQVLSVSGQGYARYVVETAVFRSHLERLVELGFTGVSLGEAIAPTSSVSRPVGISFDDGCASDLRVAAPALATLGFSATSFVTTGFLGRRGFMDAVMLRELASAGVEIGSHGHTHRFFSDLASNDLDAELVQSRDMLEQMLGRAITMLSCPGGRVNARVTAAVQRAGYDVMATSRVGTFSTGGDRLDVPRMAILSDATPADVARMAEGRGLLMQRARASALGAAKRALGNRLYDALRAVALGDSQS